MPLIVQSRTLTARYYTELLDFTELDMISIPGGSYMMGSPEAENDRYGNESPQHLVTVAPFYMGRYPVTQMQWQFVAGLPSIKQRLEQNPSQFKGDNRPVEQVSWYDAVEFCARLSEYTGRAYRLPSEAEWEYACRSHTKTPFWFGDTITAEMANYDASKIYGKGQKGECRDATTSVDCFGFVNQFGLSDMHGNIYEWCDDQWHLDYKGAPETGSSWADLVVHESSFKVLRGGAVGKPPGLCRSASRAFNAANARHSLNGFRLACFISKP
jgi:formylglycine-generating enzyme required for sulfatase activity